MMRQSITVKLWLLLVSLVVISLLTVGFSLHHLLESYYYNQQVETMLARGDMLARSLANNDNLAAQAEILGKLAGTGVMFIDRQGQVISCSSNGTTGMSMDHMMGHSSMHIPTAGMHLNDTDIEQVLQGTSVVKHGYQETFQADMLTVAVPVRVNGDVTGAVILFAPQASLSAAMAAVDRLILYAGLGAVLLATILAIFAARRVTRPLKQMNRIALNMAQGDFSGRVPVTSGDEIGRLARSFNNLSAELAQSITALSREKEKLNRVVRGITDGVLAFELNGRVLFSNPQAEKLLNLQLVPGMSLPAALVAPLQAAVGGEGTTGEIKWGQQVIAVRAAPLPDEETRAQAAVAILQDVTKQKQLDQLRREFLASVSHELRTPLSFIQGYAEALADGMASSEKERQEYSGIILAEARRLRRLIEDLFDLNKMAAGHLALDLAPIAMGELLTRVARKYQPLLADQNLSLTMEIAPSLPLIKGDAVRLEQVVINLLDNARHHTPAGGKITIAATQVGTELKVSIADTGHGIPPEDLPYIWERFYKVDKSRSRRDGGSGLGLAIVKSLVEAHGGRVEVESTPGKGSIFSFFLPVLQQLD
ncbi:cell wall metabolism sensor histidine kinase WalK [Moorella sulfitireducens (nom. illeg.)]|uniref:cell wall metabolism sensor histidine kinase WalK n=1 Tax=Neomoorella sulfitireducens TaxID=2972948 RepID=UPI0021ABED2C|nr:cell wall metabolism sensor histidine kinase WalK [Moorella sulfitireducens]